MGATSSPAAVGLSLAPADPRDPSDRSLGLGRGARVGSDRPAASSSQGLRTCAKPWQLSRQLPAASVTQAREAQRSEGGGGPLVPQGTKKPTGPNGPNGPTGSTKRTTKQTNKQTNKQASKQPTKQASKQTSKQTKQSKAHRNDQPTKQPSKSKTKPKQNQTKPKHTTSGCQAASQL